MEEFIRAGDDFALVDHTGFSEEFEVEFGVPEKELRFDDILSATTKSDELVLSAVGFFCFE